MDNDHLYVIGEGAPSGIVKIGRSVRPKARLTDFQTGYPRKLELLHVEPKAGHLEARLHRRFASNWTYGEWFDFGEADPVAAVQSALKEVQRPDYEDDPRKPRRELSENADTYLHMHAVRHRLGLSDERIVPSRVEPDAHYSDGSGKLHPLWLTSTIDEHADALQNVRRGKLPKGFEKLRRAVPTPEQETELAPAPAEVPADAPVVAAETPDAPGADDDSEDAQIGAEGREETPREDQDVVLSRLKMHTTPGGMVYDQALDLDLMMYVTRLSEERIQAAIKALCKSGRIRFDSDDHAWITA